MKNFKNKSFLLLGLIIMLTACERLEIRNPLESDDAAPGPITDIRVENLQGGANITYSLPKDDDMLYVQAEYEIRQGVKQEVRASLYSNALTVLGFGETKEYTVSLYSVDRSGNKSTSVDVKVNPLMPAVLSAFETLDYEGGFGGINMNFENASKTDLAATVIIKDSFGDWVEYDKYYTGLANAAYSVRGLPSRPTVFGVYISDRWNNASDTLIKELTPLFETKLNKGRFATLSLPGEALNVWKFADLWDDITTDNKGYRSNGKFPMHFHINLGTESRLSRFRIWGVYDGREYSSSNLKEFALWGSNSPNPNGSYDGWTFIDEYEVIRPSGLRPGDELTADDRAVAAAGYEFIVPPGTPAFKYLRINLLSSFSVPRNASNGEIWIREISFWGQ